VINRVAEHKCRDETTRLNSLVALYQPRCYNNRLVVMTTVAITTDLLLWKRD